MLIFHWRFFIHFHQEYWLIIFFPYSVLILFMYIILTSQNEFESVLSSSVFGRVWQVLILVLIWMFCRTHLWSLLMLAGLWCVGRFLITDSISLLASISSDFLFLPERVLEDCVTENQSISSRLSNVFGVLLYVVVSLSFVFLCYWL